MVLFGGSQRLEFHHKINESKRLQSMDKAPEEDDPRPSSSSNSEEDDEAGDDYEDDGFIIKDEEVVSEDDASDSPRKDKKSKKKDKRRAKERRHRHEDQEMDQGDFDVIDDNHSKVFSRLKKTETQKKYTEDHRYEDNEEEEINSQEDDIEEDSDHEGNVEYGGYHQDDSEQELSAIQQVHYVPRDVFQPSDIKRLTIEEEDKELVQVDLPERQLVQLRYMAKSAKKTLSEIIRKEEQEDRQVEADWIYERLRQERFFQSIDDRVCRQQICLILEAIHKQHLEVMYIYHYRRKIYANIMNLVALWKIADYDEEWQPFKTKHTRLTKNIVEVMKSFENVAFEKVPRQLQILLSQCTDYRLLRYFQDYDQFMLAKLITNTDPTSKKQTRFSFVSQVYDRKVAEELQKSQIFLNPKDLCVNLRSGSQDIKPKTPHSDPKEYFQLILRSSNPENDKVRYPLLASDLRFQTISKYLSLELFSYPELRLLLKDRYYKRLVISTIATKKGAQDIDLYSMYFPVKRIKDKPVSTLKPETWILILQAEKMELIRMDLKFDWELSFDEDREKHADRDLRDSVYIEIIKYYFDVNANKSGGNWNIFRKRVIFRMLDNYFFPAFMKEVKEELTREGQKQIIQAACQKFRNSLNKGPSLKEGKPIKILAIVCEHPRLGMAFVNENNEVQLTHHQKLASDEDIKNFVNQERLSNCIKDHKPDMILIAANCRRAQTLRKELREKLGDPKLFPQSIFCSFGEYEVPRLVAKKQLIEGNTTEEHVLAAISMARMRKNPMAEILSLWSSRNDHNGVMSMNLHYLQSYVDQRKLRESLYKVGIEMVNLVGLDINQIRQNQRAQVQLQFVSGLGPKKAFVFIEKLKNESVQIINRKKIEQFVVGKTVYRNCSSIFKVETSLHRNLLQKMQKEKKKMTDQINLLDMTRIPDEWQGVILKRITELIRSLIDARTQKAYANLPDLTIALIEIFKHPEKIDRMDWKCKDVAFFDEDFVRSEIAYRFKSPREAEQAMENREIFFNLLRETPESLKRYMILPVKVLSSKNNYLNVVIPENGLFGYIKVQHKKQEDIDKIYEKGTNIKAVLIGFPFDEKKYAFQPDKEQELLKVEMALDFPHKDKIDERHDCISICFPSIVRELHPLIDLDKNRFQLKKSDKPVLEVVQERNVKTTRIEHRRISHPKFKNIAAGPAIELMKTEPIGEFVLRPSSQGIDYLTITWNFFKGVVSHIKVRCEHKPQSSAGYTFRIEDRDNKTFNSLEEMTEKHIKPMNVLVQDVISNKKFIASSLESIEDKIKTEMSRDSSHIYYYFGCSEEYPQYFVLLYMYKDKRPVKELVKVRCTGLYFHEQQFQNVRDLIAWFKEHLKDRDYQKYVKSYALRK